MPKCCAHPSIRREYFAFRRGDHYSCFNGFFPADSCLSCGSANFAFGSVKWWLFELLNLVDPWDGAMCRGEHVKGE